MKKRISIPAVLLTTLAYCFQSTAIAHYIKPTVDQQTPPLIQRISTIQIEAQKRDANGLEYLGNFELAQWYNWGNWNNWQDWGNWNNWQDWGNWGNWGNY